MKDRESDGSLDNRIFVGGLSLRGSFKILFTAMEKSSSVRSTVSFFACAVTDQKLQRLSCWSL